MDDILPKLNIFVENNLLENKKLHTSCLTQTYNKSTLFKGTSIRSLITTFMIGSFKINVLVKKSVTPTFHYMSKIISVTCLVFKLLSAKQRTAKLLLWHFITHYYFIVQQGNKVFLMLTMISGMWKTIYL